MLRLSLAVTWLPIICGVMYTALSWSLSKVLSGLRWNYINFIRIVLGDAKVATLDDIGILYRSKHFLVVNKRQDVKINSNDPTDLVTVETQLRHRFPEYVDEKTVHGFRFVVASFKRNSLRRDEIDAILQTIVSIAFSWMKMNWVWLKFHWSLFPRVQLIIFQHWFR